MFEAMKAETQQRKTDACERYRELCFAVVQDQPIDEYEAAKVCEILGIDVAAMERDIEMLKARRRSADVITGQVAEAELQASGIESEAQAIRQGIAEKEQAVQELQAEIFGMDQQARGLEQEAAGIRRDATAQGRQAKEHLRVTGPDLTRARKAYDAARDQWQNRNLAINRRLDVLHPCVAGIAKIGDIQAEIDVLQYAVNQWDEVKFKGSLDPVKIAADRARLRMLAELPSRWNEIHAEIARLMTESQNNKRWFNSVPVPDVSTDWRDGRLAIAVDGEAMSRSGSRPVMAENAVPVN